MRKFRSKASSRFRETASALTTKNPSLNQAQSVGGSLQLISQMCPRLRPSSPVCTHSSEIKAFSKKKTGRKLPNTSLEYGVILENTAGPPPHPTPPPPPHRPLLGNRMQIEICTDVCARSPFEKESISWESGIGIGWVLVVHGVKS